MAGKLDPSQKTYKMAKRSPLKDGMATANIMKPPLPTTLSSPTKLDMVIPKNESLAGDGSHSIRRTLASPQKPTSQVSSDTVSDSKRNSVLSTISTNASNTPRKRKTHIGPWQLGSTVGKGGTARVRKVRHAVTGKTGVAKIVPVAAAEKARAMSLANLVESAENGDPTLYFDKAIPLGLEREIAIMKCLEHPNIVRLYDVWENRSEIYLIMEYVPGGELFDYVASNQRLGEDVTIYLFRQMIWALRYCHGLNIHHRDLKPENILLDYDTMTVKLVDFGMAALQPEGNLLSTPCGSPHYAAPELLQNRPYNGGQADVWSVGVVLFVMLHGLPPFNFPIDPRGAMSESDKLKALFQAIARADYKMPSNFSQEAQDLIRRVFVVDPKKRITIDEIWEHPFIHKFDTVWGEHAKLESSDSLAELSKAAHSWKPLRQKSVDPQIFRALRTLWHSESDVVLLEKLCSREFNQAKFFYHAMLRYREQNLGNFDLSSASFGYSASDHQHSKPTFLPSSLSEVSQDRSVTSMCRTKSTYSITGNEHLSSKHSYYDLPVSEASYDPFRASRSLLATPKIESLNVTVHGRHSSRNSRGNSLRIDLLRGNSRRSSARSSQRSSVTSSSKQRRKSAKRSSSKSSSSRLSMGSSILHSGSPVAVMRPSELHKRGVQFPNHRNSLTAGVFAVSGGRVPDHRARALHRLELPALKPDSATLPAAAAPLPSPPLRAKDQVVVLKKRAAVAPTPRAGKFNDQAEVAARKVSVELGKACDEAFWKESGSSSPRSAADVTLTFVDTPPSSVRPSPGRASKELNMLSDRMRNRPLPATPRETRSTLQPSETPSTFTTRELAEMRERLALRYAKENTGTQEYFNDVLLQLDMLMKSSETRNQSLDDRRTVSAPPNCSYADVSTDWNNLQVIPEEVGMMGSEDRRVGSEVERDRVTHGPLDQRRQVMLSSSDANTTIRIVNPSHHSVASESWAPLNIRKSHSTSSRSTQSIHSKMDRDPWNTLRDSLSSSKRHAVHLSSAPYSTSPLQQTLLEESSDAIATVSQSRCLLDRPWPPNVKGEDSASNLDCASLDNHDSIADEYFDRFPLPDNQIAIVDCDKTNLQTQHVRSPCEPATPSGNRGTWKDTKNKKKRSFFRLSTIEEDPKIPSSSDEILRNDLTQLNDRKITRDQRAALKHEKSRWSPDTVESGEPGTLTKVGRKLMPWRKLKEGSNHRENCSSNGTANTYNAMDSDTGLIAHKDHAGQKDFDHRNDLSMKENSMSGFFSFLREHCYTPMITPTIYVIALSVPRDKAWDRAGEAIDPLHQGYRILSSDNSTFTMRIKCSPKSCISGVHKKIVFLAEFFPLSQGNQHVDACLLRLVQRTGPASSLAAVAKDIENFLDLRGVLVKDAERAAEMKAALHQGLSDRNECLI